MLEGEASDRTIEPQQAMRMLGKFMENHSTHYGCHQPDIRADGITLLCDGHTQPVLEVIDIEPQMMRKAMGLELAERRMVTF